MEEGTKRIYGPLDPPEKRSINNSFIWISVMLLLFLIFVSVIAFFALISKAAQATELELVRAELAQTQQNLEIAEQKLEIAEEKIEGSRYVIEKAQDSMDRFLDLFVDDSPGAFTRMKIVSCEEPIDNAMRKVYGSACDDLRDFADKYYTDSSR